MSAVHACAHACVCVQIIINWTVSRSHPLCSPTRETLLQPSNGEIIGGGQATCENIRKVTFLNVTLACRVINGGSAGEVSGPECRATERVNDGGRRLRGKEIGNRCVDVMWSRRGEGRFERMRGLVNKDNKSRPTLKRSRAGGDVVRLSCK